MHLIRSSAIFLAAGTAMALAGGLPDPVSDAAYAPVKKAEAILGQLLFYDAILSGNRNIACATCHHPDFATGDDVSLGLGEGGIGLGLERRGDPDNMPLHRIPRNSPALFNLGATEFTVLFHDGRIEVDADMPSGFRTPLDDDMLDGFASLLSAQTMFPVLSADEMAGHDSENDVAKAVRQGLITGQGGAWDILSRRVAALPDYAQRFVAVYDNIDTPDDIAFTDISNAIAAFVGYEWRSDTAAFDAKLRRQSFDPQDLILAHVGAMDVCAKGLIAAAKMLEDGTLEAARAARYAGWTSEQGQGLLQSDLETINAEVTAKGLNPQPASGRQEALENLVNRFV